MLIIHISRSVPKKVLFSLQTGTGMLTLQIHTCLLWNEIFYLPNLIFAKFIIHNKKERTNACLLKQHYQTNKTIKIYLHENFSVWHEKKDRTVSFQRVTTLQYYINVPKFHLRAYSFSPGETVFVNHYQEKWDWIWSSEQPSSPCVSTWHRSFCYKVD